MTKGRRITVLCIKFAESDGLVYASSPDLPGLHLCGKSKKAVLADLPEMVKALYRMNNSIEVDVEPAFDSGFKHKSKPSAISNWLQLLAAPIPEMQAA